MATQKQKFELFQRLAALGFTFEEAQKLRKIEMTLSRWSTAECNGEIQRDAKRDASGAPIEGTDGEGLPRRYWQSCSGEMRHGSIIADREKGALQRLAEIVKARNSREVIHDAFTIGTGMPIPNPENANFLFAYHQGDPRGCSLYLVTRAQLGTAEIDSVYYRGIAVCA